MELLQLRYFVTVAKMGSITKAANFHGIPQPAMSQTIARLEADLGNVRLFDRKSNRIYLNDNGKKFLKRVEFALQSLDDGIQELNSASNEITGRINLLVLENHRFIFNCVSHFSKEYPNVNFFISHNYYSEQNIIYDLCISSMQTYHQMKTSIPLIKEHIILVVHEDHPLARRTSVRLSELKNEKFITMSAQSSLYHITIDQCRSCGFEPHVQSICDDPYFVRKYVSENMGIALAPEVSWAGRFRKNTVIIPIDNPPIFTTSYLIWNQNRYLTPAVQAFRRFLTDESRKLSGNLCLSD
ncbi:MAG: LysR family transcriptional regulator [Clostridiaceae bacterium]|nr:LysR family transcriptional regulator [Clostridiaceae bacterium]